MVAEEDDDGPVGQIEFVQGSQHDTDLRVHEGGGGAIGLDGLATQIVGQLFLFFLVAAERRGRGAGTVVGGHLRRVDLVGRVHVEVLLRGDVGGVGAEEAARQEEGPVGVLPEQFGDLCRGLAVGLFLIRPVGGQPAQGATETGRALGPRIQREDLFLVVLVPAARVDRPFPAGRVVQAIGADLRGHAVVEKLADAGHAVAGLAEGLREALRIRHVLAELRGVLVDAQGIRAQARQEAGPARVAERELAVSPVEPDASSRQGVDVRRRPRAAVAAQCVVGQVVRDDEQHVHRPGRVGVRGARDEGESRQGENQPTHGASFGFARRAGAGWYRKTPPGVPPLCERCPRGATTRPLNSRRGAWADSAHRMTSSGRFLSRVASSSRQIGSDTEDFLSADLHRLAESLPGVFTTRFADSSCQRTGSITDSRTCVDWRVGYVPRFEPTGPDWTRRQEP